MKAVVFAYHDMGCTGIQSLLDAGYDIAAIFTHPDNPGENHFFGSVARLAAEQGIPVWAPEDVNHPLWIERIREMKPDVLFSFYYRNLHNRFVGQFIASRSRKGYGPARIRQELSQKGIARQVVDQAMRECDIDWVSLAREQAQRKYGEPLPSAFTEKVKVQRFLLYRGYLMEDIQEIWRNFAD